jgi:hypothetical protein
MLVLGVVNSGESLFDEKIFINLYIDENNSVS